MGYTVCLNGTMINITAIYKTKDPIITDRSVSLNGLKTPGGIYGSTLLVNQNCVQDTDSCSN